MANSDRIKINPRSPVILRMQLNNKAERVFLDSPPPSDRMRQMLAGSLIRCFILEGLDAKDAKRSRYAITEWLTGFTSVYDVPEAMIRSMLDWLDLGPKPEHRPSAVAVKEAWLVLDEAMKDQGQEELL